VYLSGILKIPNNQGVKKDSQIHCAFLPTSYPGRTQFANGNLYPFKRIQVRHFTPYPAVDYQWDFYHRKHVDLLEGSLHHPVFMVVVFLFKLDSYSYIPIPRKNSISKLFQQKDHQR